MRVVPNLYPALERQEVVVHSPRHVRSFADLSEEEIAAAAGAWRARAREAERAGFGYVHAMINEGRLAGASLAHSHSQLVWLREPPPAVEAEAGGLAPLLEKHPVAEVDGVVAAIHPFGRAPYELLIAPREPATADAFAEGPALAAALGLLRSTIRRLREIEGPLPWNAWLHLGPQWHLEVVPRLTVFAGLELGAGIHVNVVDPAAAADALRREPAAD